MVVELKETEGISLAQRVAGEDLQPGDYVSRFRQRVELPSYLWDATALPPDQLVVLHRQDQNAGLPLKVILICLPFVYVKPPVGALHVIDLRQMQLVRLGAKVGRKAWKHWKRDQSRSQCSKR